MNCIFFYNGKCMANDRKPCTGCPMPELPVVHNCGRLMRESNDAE